MRRNYFLAGIIMILMLSGCGSESTPTSESTPASTGISGTVKYNGSQTGNILVYVTNQAPKPNEAPKPTAMTEITGASGDFKWDLSAGTYYISAFLAVNRSPQGPPQSNEPSVNCNAILVNSGQDIKVEVVLTDADAVGTDKSCVKKT